MAGAVMLAKALAERPGAIDEALAAYEARLPPGGGGAADGAAERPPVHARRLFTPADRFQSLAREAVLRPAARPLLAPVVRTLLSHKGEQLQRRGRFARRRDPS